MSQTRDTAMMLAVDAETQDLRLRVKGAFEAARRRGITTGEIARRLGLNPEGGIRDWASGKRLPPRKHWDALAKELGDPLLFTRPDRLAGVEALLAELLERCGSLEVMLGMYLDGDPRRT